MTDKPSDAAIQRACDRRNAETNGGWTTADYDNSPALRAFAKEIQQASDIAKEADLAFERSHYSPESHVRNRVRSLTLSDPEADLLKQAREICAKDAEANGYMVATARYRSGAYDDHAVIRCTLAALKSVKEAG